MGLSLRNITHKISDILGDVAHPIEHAVGGLGTSAKNIAVTPYNATRLGAADLTHNNLARTNAMNSLRTSRHAAGGFAQWPGQAGESIFSTVVNRPTFNQTNSFERLVAGRDPVPSVQGAYSLARKRGESIPTALTESGLTATSDLPIGLKGAKLIKDTSLPRVSMRKSETPSPITTKSNTVGQRNVSLKLPPVADYTEAPKSPSTVDRAWQTVNGVIAQHGTGGAEIARRLGEARAQSEIGQQAFLDKIPAVNKLKKDDFETFVQSLGKLDKSQKVSVKPHIQQAISQWNQAIPSIRDRGVGAKLDIGDLGPNYFPRSYKDLFSNDQKMSRMAADMVGSGKASDLGDAMGKLRFMKNEYQRPYGNLEKTRQFDLPGYEMTHEALTGYIGRAFDRISKAEQFGAKNEVLHQLQARAEQEGFHAAPGSKLDDYIKIAFGDVNKNSIAHKVSSGVRKFNALRSLSTAGISNATQLPVNTGTIAGLGRTFKGAAVTAVSKEARARAHESGVLLDHAIAQLAQQGLGTSGAITRNVASPFFRQIEKFNRMATAVVGEDYGNHLAKTGDTAQLRDKFGVTGDIGQSLTRDQRIQVQRKLVELSQFKVDPMDLPGWVDSPLGKLAAQFRTFGYKQTGFMYNQVLREAMKGNFLPLGRFIAIGTPSGAAALAIKSAVKGTKYTDPNESKGSQVAKALAQVGGFGLPGSEGQNIYQSSRYGNTPSAVIGTVGGPTASFVTETAGNIQKGQQKKDWSKLEKQAIRSIPAVGPSVANRLMPTKPFVQANSSGSGGTPEQRTANAKAEKATLAKNAGNGFALMKTSDGRFAYTLDGDTSVHTAGSLKTAQTAVAEAQFKQEGMSYKVVGDTVYRKSTDGTVSKITKDSFDYRVNTATLTAQKRAGDVEGWFKTANSQLELIQKQLNEPNVDPLDALTLKNEAQSLMSQMDKYQGYGDSFTKPKGYRGGGGSGSSRVAQFNPNRVTLKLSTGGKVSTPSLSAPKAKAKVAKKGGAARPKVSLKKLKT